MTDMSAITKSKLWAPEGQIQADRVKMNPNGTAIFHITDEGWLRRNGWGKESYVEVQARPMPTDRIVPQDLFAWEE